jgi:septal ring factor EnvC (AmiA/AmiB activator)
MNKHVIFFLLIFLAASISEASERNSFNDIDISNLDKIEKEIEAQEKELENIEDSKMRISKNISIIEDKLLYLRQAIGKLNIEYKELLKEINETEQKSQMIKKKVQFLENEIKQNNIYILENFQMLKVKALILTDNYHQILKNLDIAEYINLTTYNKILAYNNTKADYEKSLNKLNTAKQRLVSLKNKRDLLVINYENEQIRYKHTLAMLSEDTTIKKAYIEMLKKKKDALEENFKLISKQPQNITADSIAKSKGTLPWPIKGTIIQNDKDSLQNSIFNNGIRISAKNDENVKAVFNGIIQYINWIKGYGNIVIVAHDNNYFTVYANLDLVGVQLNESVKSGEPIGKINIEGAINTPYIYFEIRQKDKILNPLEWLRKEA